MIMKQMHMQERTTTIFFPLRNEKCLDFMETTQLQFTEPITSKQKLLATFCYKQIGKKLQDVNPSS